MAAPTLGTNSPSVGSISWTGFNIQYNGVTYVVAPGNTSERFVWWRYNGGAPLLQAGPALPDDLTIQDFVLFGNKNGTPLNIQTAGLVEGGLIVDGSILTDSLSANSVTGEKILAGTVNATHIEAHSITANEVAADVIVTNEVYAVDGVHVVSPTGASLDLTAESGYQQRDSAGAVRVSFPIDPSPDAPFQFDGDLITRSQTVLDQFGLRGTKNEISTGAKLILQGGVTAPNSPPTATVDWANKPIAGSYNPMGFAKFNGLYWSTDSIYSGMALAYNEEAGAFARSPVNTPERWVGPGADVAGAFGVAFIGSSLYLLCWSKEAITGTYYNDYYVYRYDWSGTAWSANGRWRYRPSGTTLGGYSSYQPALGVKGGNLIIAQCATTGVAWVHEFTIAGAQVASSTLKTGVSTNWGPAANFRAIEYGNFDYGSARYVTVRASSAIADTWDGATLINTPADSFALPVASVVGLVWDSAVTAFRSRSAETVYDHTAVNWATGGTSTTWLGASSWHDPNATGGTHETEAGTPVTFTMRKRARVTLTAPPIPARPVPNTNDDVTAVRLYVAQSNPAKLDRIASPAAGVRSVTITTTPAFPTTPTNPPPSSNNFPAAAPAEISSSAQVAGLPAWMLRGDGSATARDPLMPTDIPNKRYVDERIKSGRTTVSLATTGTPVNVNVTFPSGGFASIPVVTTGIESTNPHFFDVGISSVTATGFVLTATRRSGSNTGVAVQWIAAP